MVGNSPAAAAGSGNRDLRSGADTSGPPSTNGNDRGASPADTVTGQPGNPFFTAPPGSLRTASPTNAGTTATQGVTSAVGVPTGATTTGTGSTGVAGSAGSTTAGTGATGTTSVPGALAMTTTEQTATGTINSPALTIEGGTGLTGPTSAPAAPSSTSLTTPTTAITPTGTTATGASTTGLSSPTGAGTTTGFIGGSGTPSQTAPTGFFTFDFNAKSEPVAGGTKKTSASEERKSVAVRRRQACASSSLMLIHDDRRSRRQAPAAAQPIRPQRYGCRAASRQTAVETVSNVTHVPKHIFHRGSLFFGRGCVRRASSRSSPLATKNIKVRSLGFIPFVGPLRELSTSSECSDAQRACLHSRCGFKRKKNLGGPSDLCSIPPSRCVSTPKGAVRCRSYSLICLMPTYTSPTCMRLLPVLVVS